MDDNKPVRFRLRKLQSPIDEDVQAISLIFGFFSIKFGWIANVPISNENQPND
jgi:hypothetical protein